MWIDFLREAAYTGAMKNNTLEDELDAIRIELYEQTKHMSPDAEIAYLRQLVAPINEEFGITPITWNDIEEGTPLPDEIAAFEEYRAAKI